MDRRLTASVLVGSSSVSEDHPFAAVSDVSTGARRASYSTFARDAHHAAGPVEGAGPAPVRRPQNGGGSTAVHSR